MARVPMAIAAILIAALLGASPGRAARKPTLTLVTTRPVKVHALGFEPGERVRLAVHAANGLTRSTTTADRDGRFTATVRGAVVDRCAPLLIRASGSAGSRSVLRRSPRCPVAAPSVVDRPHESRNDQIAHRTARTQDGARSS